MSLQPSAENIAILIPAYNPSSGLLDLIKNLRKMGCDIRILLVNDGSDSKHAHIFNQAVSVDNVDLVSHAVNIGKGAALKTGINHLLVNHPQLKSIVTADADGQHAPEDIFKMTRESMEYPDKLILGYRTFDKDIPLRSKLGNNISKIVYKYLLGLKLYDTQTGLRSIPKSLAVDTLKIKANKYELETEQLVLTAKKKIALHQIPIQTIYEDNNSSSHFNPIFDSIRIYYALLRYTLASLITALTDFIAFLLFSSLTDSIIMSNLCSRYVALFVQFFLLRKFVFKTDGGILKFIAFVGIVSITGVISGLLQNALTDYTGSSIILSKILVDSGLFLFNFLFLRDILFKRNDID